jgi:hypothetical protein
MRARALSTIWSWSGLAIRFSPLWNIRSDREQHAGQEYARYPLTPTQQSSPLCRDDGLGADKFLGLVWRVRKRLAHILAELSPPMKEVAPCREGTGLKS